MTLQSIGIVVFIVVQVLNVLGLSVDLALWETGLPTISYLARRHLWIAASIIMLNGIGVFGLAMHFSDGKG